MGDCRALSQIGGESVEDQDMKQRRRLSGWPLSLLSAAPGTEMKRATLWVKRVALLLVVVLPDVALALSAELLF